MEWTKAIPEERDRLQSRVLVWAVGIVLFANCVAMAIVTTNPDDYEHWTLRAGIVSLTFGVVVWVLRAATPMAAFCGFMVCWVVTARTNGTVLWPELHSGLMPLLALFVLTFAATKAGKRRKRAAGLEESRRGRNAAQILANLGAAALAAISGASAADVHSAFGRVMVLGCLAEATADTVSSEIGAVFGGKPFLVTTWRRVEAGTDGAVSLLGTLAGCVGAAVVVAVGVWAMGLSAAQGFASFAGGVAGLWFDSALGATVERKGWLGNDLVNFVSTVVGGLAALGVELWMR
jgi:uncharacterized protein (TIGR00297 family)